MGKWAQSRKRGSGETVEIAVTPPPAPTLSDDGSYLIQTANGTDDTDGSILLERGDTPAGPWNPVDVAEWATPYAWGSLAGLAGFVYRATESGNGTAYVGISAPSNVYDLT